MGKKGAKDPVRYATWSKWLEVYIYAERDEQIEVTFISAI